MSQNLPSLSRFELQCLRKLWTLQDASVRRIHEALDDPPSYSTVRKIFERLEAKGAVMRVRREGRAWIYRATVPRAAMIHGEIRRFLNQLFDGATGPLMANLAEMDALSLDDLREIESRLKKPRRGTP